MPAGWKTVLIATLAGLALRLFFIFKFPATAGDTPIYDEIARNWLDHHVYGLIVNGHLTPVAHRLPGYPAFLAVVYAAFGRTARAVMIVQAVLDLVTCLLAAGLAARLVCWCTSYGNSTRASLTSTDAGARRVSTVALWLCALCPFTANYTAVVLTETLATFLITLALTLLLEAFAREDSLERGSVMERGQPAPASRGLVRAGAADVPSVSTNAIPIPRVEGTSQELRASVLQRVPRSTTLWLAAGFVTGLATLVRPESPLLLFAIGIALIILWRRPANWPRLVRAGVWLAVGLILPLLPWAARN